MTHSDELVEPHEAELRDLLERTMHDAAPPTGIGPHALIRGRRLRTRRRIGVAAGAVAASAVAVLVVPATLGGGSTTVVDPAGEPSSAASGPASVPRELPPGWWSMPAVDMVSAVEAILPDGVTVTDPGPLEADTPEGGPAVGWIDPVITGPTGPGHLNLMLYPVIATDEITVSPESGSTDGGDQVVAPSADGGCDAPELADSTVPCTELDTGDELVVGDGQLGGVDGDVSCPGNLAPRAQCTEIRAANGDLIGRTSSTTFGQVTTLEVVLRRDGGTVYGATANALDEKWGRTSQPSAQTPPLTLDQLEAIVRNDTWVKPAT